MSKKYLNISGGYLKPNVAGKKYLKDSVTNTEGDVYGFYPNKLSTITIAAAMARLSRNFNDMRITILSEFAEDQGKDDSLLRRVITAFGDDSVQQLVGQHLVIERASNLLTKQIEWGRLAAYLEQSTRYIYFDEKDSNGRYKYYTPSNLDKKGRSKYDKEMDAIFDNYSDLVHKLTDYIIDNSDEPEEGRTGAWRAAVRAQACDAIRPTLPVATQSTVGVFASAQAIENMVMRLRASESLEARTVGDQILAEMRKVIPTFLERADKPERGGATSAYLSTNAKKTEELTEQLITKKHSSDQKSVNLYSVHPQNELDIVPDILYEHTNLSRDELKSETEKLSSDQKKQVIDAYIGERLNRRHRPGRALENIQYNFDLMCDYGIFRDLQRHRMVNDLRWQKLSVNFGYEIPKLVTDAGLENRFKHSFELSEALYKYLNDAGYEYESQYAVLMGHNMRWRVGMNARAAFHFLELRTTPHGHPGYRKLCKQMYDEIAKVHPHIASHMIFINKDEDPKLTRLAAERATEYKLKMLDKKETKEDSF